VSWINQSANVRERIARIEAACASDLGYAMRGVTSWQQEWLVDWRGRDELTPTEMRRLLEIEIQVFGDR
jgi:hypothetical protein